MNNDQFVEPYSLFHIHKNGRCEVEALIMINFSVCGEMRGEILVLLKNAARLGEPLKTIKVHVRNTEY